MLYLDCLLLLVDIMPDKESRANLEGRLCLCWQVSHLAVFMFSGVFFDTFHS